MVKNISFSFLGHLRPREKKKKKQIRNGHEKLSGKMIRFKQNKIYIYIYHLGKSQLSINDGQQREQNYH